MNFVALRMLVGDRAKYLGILVGLTFASLLITQQLAIFTGLMSRTFGAISDRPFVSRPTTVTCPSGPLYAVTSCSG